MNAKKLTIWTIMILYATSSANAVKVGVLVEFPDKTRITECVDVPENTNGYELMQRTGLNLLWAGPSMFGHSLCKINGVGTDVSGDYCKYTGKYWGLMLADNGAWTYMPVGWDGGDNCWNQDPASFTGHYCAREGDVLGYRFGEWGDMPGFESFEEICRPRSRIPQRTLDVEVTPADPVVGDKVTLSTGVRGVEVVVRDEAGLKVFDGETDREGETYFWVSSPGKHSIALYKKRYHREEIEFTVSEKEKITSSSTSTTSSTTTSTTTSTITFRQAPATSSSTIKTTSTTQPPEMTTLQKPLITGQVVAHQPSQGIITRIIMGIKKLLRIG